MRQSRREFLTAAAAGGAVLALDRAPAFAQKRELTLLSFNHFVPASDDELRRQADLFSKQAGVPVRVDTIAGPQMFAKRAAEVSSQSGHDINHHPSLSGPGGTHTATGVNSLGIWKFSKQVPLAKDFIKFLFQRENYHS